MTPLAIAVAVARHEAAAEEEAYRGVALLCHPHAAMEGEGRDQVRFPRR
jgi:alpha/beta superfamily hydrolase